jgi:hypothetical protein
VIGGQRLAGRFALGGRNGKLDTQGRAGFLAAVQIDVAAERLYSILEAEQAGSAGKVGTSDAVVSDLEVQNAFGGLLVDGNRDGRCARVFGRVGQYLGDDVVGADLHLIGQSFCYVQVELNGDGRSDGLVRARPG